MEIFELRYFLGVAATENIHKASEQLNISPGSLSKAISRLEGELGVNLFQRQGRNIELTDHGRLLQKNASELVHLEESARMAISGHQGSIRVVMAGTEILLSRLAAQLTKEIRKSHPLSVFEYQAVTDQEAILRVQRGEAHIAIVSFDPPTKMYSKQIELAEFQTYVGAGHPLFSAAKSKKIVKVEEVLKFPFVSPSHAFLGSVGPKQSLDGWRDDKFPRKIQFLASSLKLIEELAVGGQAIAYLPDYYASSLELASLKISGCPYYCNQKLKLVVRDPNEISWLRSII